jgi:hypothetical protein
MVRRIRLMADYICYPLWEMDPSDSYEIDPRSLPLRQETILRLDHWADIYDGILNMDDPASSGFKTEKDEEDWIQEGVLLWKLLQQELGTDYQVYYYLERTATNIVSQEELEELFPGKYTKNESPYSSAQFKERILTFVYYNDSDSPTT